MQLIQNIIVKFEESINFFIKFQGVPKKKFFFFFFFSIFPPPPPRSKTVLHFYLLHNFSNFTPQVEDLKRSKTQADTARTALASEHSDLATALNEALGRAENVEGGGMRTSRVWG